MKAEINNENKAKFFQLYSGQQIISVRTYNDLKTPYQAQFINDGMDRKLDSIAHLKPLSQISDEDALRIGIIYGGFTDTPEDLQDYKDHVYLALIEDDEEAYNMWDHIGFQIMSQVIDYLRSSGYALPWMGLSVEEMIEAGWIKLTEA